MLNTKCDFIIKRTKRSLNIVCKDKTEVFIKYYFYLNLFKIQNLFKL